MQSKSKQCYKLSNEDKKDILLAYNLDNSNDNIQAICKKYNITRQTIKCQHSSRFFIYCN